MKLENFTMYWFNKTNLFQKNVSKRMPFIINEGGAKSSAPKALSWLEIGTSDFNTFAQSEGVKSGEYGMSVEPVKSYLDRLPDRIDIVKVHAAVSNVDGKADVYYVTEEDIKKHELPDWVRGCNTIGLPHPTVEKTIQGKDVSFQVDSVKKFSYGTLMKTYNIRSVTVLKIDTEGHDCVILKSMLAFCSQNPSLYPRVVTFESNELTPKQEVDATVAALKSAEYILLERGYNTTMVKL